MHYLLVQSNFVEKIHAWVISGGRLGVTTQEYDEWWTFLTADRFAPFQSTLVSNTGGYHMYYVNWGWNGSYDGYYSNLDNIAPNQHGNSQYNAIEYEQLLIAKPDI